MAVVRVFDIICLVNSRKYCGRCVAGLRIDGGGWFRPVTQEEHGTLAFGQAYCGGTEALPLDVVKLIALMLLGRIKSPAERLNSNSRAVHSPFRRTTEALSIPDRGRRRATGRDVGIVSGECDAKTNHCRVCAATHGKR